MHLDVTAEVSIKLAMSIPIHVEGSAAYLMNEESTTDTQSFILSINKISFIHEIPKESYMGKQVRKFKRKLFLKTIIAIIINAKSSINPYSIHFGNIQERHLWKKNPKFTFQSLMTSYMTDIL